jgi:hypothetical protein
MIFRVLCLLAMLLPATARAQSVNIYCLTGVGSTGNPSWQPCPATGQLIALGFGSLAVTASSQAISAALTTGPNSAAWPPPANDLTWIINPTGSGGTVYVCPIGPSACTTNGVPIPAGSAYGFHSISATATIIGSTTVTAAAQW